MFCNRHKRKIVSNKFSRVYTFAFLYLWRAFSFRSSPTSRKNHIISEDDFKIACFSEKTSSIIKSDLKNPFTSQKVEWWGLWHWYAYTGTLKDGRRRLAQLVRSLTANQEVPGSIHRLVEGWTLGDLLSPHRPWTGTLNRWFSVSTFYRGT